MVRGRFIRTPVAVLAALALALTVENASLAQVEPPVTQASLPTDRTVRDFEDISPLSPGLQERQTYTTHPHRAPAAERAWYEALMFRAAAEWEPEADGITIYNSDFSVSIPMYRSHGQPPPVLAAGLSFTDLDAPTALDLPSELYDASLGLRWLREINDRWILRLTIDGVFASDSHNTSSDSWQLRGGVFGMYSKDRQTKWTFGAIATGRQDVPVLPAAGVIWQPSPRWRVDLILPQPRASYLLVDCGDRQHWVYTGGAITGGTWAYRRAAGADELLTYREWRLLLGWESKPPANPPGVYGPTGIKYGAEIGYVIGRKFEFDSGAPDIEPDGTLLLRAAVSR